MWLVLSCTFLRIQFLGELKLERSFGLKKIFFNNAIGKMAAASKEIQNYYVLIYFTDSTSDNIIA